MVRLVVELPDEQDRTDGQLETPSATQIVMACVAAAGGAVTRFGPAGAGGASSKVGVVAQRVDRDGVTCGWCGANNELLQRDRGIDRSGLELWRVNKLGPERRDDKMVVFASQYEVLYADWEVDGYTCRACGMDASLPADVDVVVEAGPDVPATW